MIRNFLAILKLNRCIYNQLAVSSPRSQVLHMAIFTYILLDPCLTTTLLQETQGSRCLWKLIYDEGRKEL